MNSQLNLAFYICLQFLLHRLVESWSIIEKPLNFFDLNKEMTNFEDQSFLYEYSNYRGNLEQYRLLWHDQKNNYMVLGARNRIIIVTLNRKSNIQVKEYDIPFESIDKHIPEYVLTMIPIEPDTNHNNMLICKTGTICPRCILSRFDLNTGEFYSFNATKQACAPQFINEKSLQNVFYYAKKNAALNEHVLYTASTQAGGRQYVSLYNSNNGNYQSSRAYKYVGQKAGKSKEFIKFIENNEKIFLFQHMNNKIADPLEKSRDISESAALVSQICKNDEGSGDFNQFYSELKAQINCFKDATPLRGNSQNFRFEILKSLSEMVQMKQNNQTRKLFYGVFNTPQETPTGTAICFFDIDDIERVFQLSNFDYEIGETVQNYKIDNNFNIQNCPALGNDEKLKSKYRSITSQFRRMKNGAYPIRRRKASFMTLHRYRISTLVVDTEADSNDLKFKNLHIIYAGTDNGKVLRIAHYFTNEYFKNEDANEERVEILEEIQLFDNSTGVNQIKIIQNNREKQIFAIALNQIKSIPTNFCHLYTSSCQSCVQHSQLDTNKCYWLNNTCMSTNQFNKVNGPAKQFARNTNECKRFEITTTTKKIIQSTTRPTTTWTSTNPTTTTTSNSESTSTLILNPVIAIKTENEHLGNNSKQIANDLWLLDPPNKAVTVLILAACFIICLILGVCLGYLVKATNLFGRFTKLPLKQNSKSSFNLKKEQNLYQDHNNSKIRIARAQASKKVNQNLNESVEKTLDFGNSSLSNSESDNSHLYDKYCICTSKKPKSSECFTVQNDYSLLPNIQQSLPPEYFKIANLQTHINKSNKENESNKNRLSSDSSSDSSYLFNLVNYSQTCLVPRNKNQHSPLGQSTTKSITLNDTDSTNVAFFNNNNNSSQRVTPNNSRLNKSNNIYQINSNNIIIVDDDEANFEPPCNLTKSPPSMDKIILDHQKRCSIISSNLSFSTNSDSSSSSSANSRDSNYKKHHHTKKQTLNSCYESASKLVIKNLPRNQENLEGNSSADDPVNIVIGPLNGNNESIEEFYVNNSYV